LFFHVSRVFHIRQQLAADASASFTGPASATGTGTGACAGDLAAVVSIALQKLHAHRAVGPLVAARLASAPAHQPAISASLSSSSSASVNASGGHGNGNLSGTSGGHAIGNFRTNTISGPSATSGSTSTSGGAVPLHTVVARLEALCGGANANADGDDLFEQIAEYVAAHATLTKYLEVYRCVRVDQLFCTSALKQF
jgi:hypothetical protein